MAVLLDVEEYEALVDRAAFVEAVQSDAQAARSGNLYSNDEAVKILDSSGE